MPKKDITIGISKEEVENLLIEAGIDEKQINAVNKIIERNNELILKYIGDNIFKIQDEARRKSPFYKPRLK